MRDERVVNTPGSRGRKHMIDASVRSLSPICFCNPLQAIPDFATLGDEIVVCIDHKEWRDLDLCHACTFTVVFPRPVQMIASAATPDKATNGSSASEKLPVASRMKPIT